MSLIKYLKIVILTFILIPTIADSQNLLESGRISGNFQIDAQLYQRDSIIGADDVPEKVLSNGFLNLLYTQGNFELGMRYEAYLDPILGFDPRDKGSGIAYRYITYHSDLIDLTGGDFYEQFGSGLIFRAYEERALGFDNAVNGFRFKFRPTKGVEVTGLIGNMRSFWNQSTGIARGGDLTLNVNDLIVGLIPDDVRLNIAGSVVSRYEPDLESKYNLPQNVLAYSTRFSLSGNSFSVDGEYAYKYNDPSASNKYSFNPGNGLILSGSLYQEGFGLSLNFHRVDNMDYRTNRDSRGNVLTMNFIPPLTKQQTYRLPTIYPYATQLNGEAGLQAELTYEFPKSSLIGGKYGTEINLNYSRVQSIKKETIDEFTYDSPFMSIGKRLYFQDANIEIVKKWSHNLKTNLTFINLIYDKDVLENEGAGRYGKVKGNVIVLEITYKFSSTNALRTEIQQLWATQDSTLQIPDNINGNWALLLAEYTVAPHWFFTVWDEYNYGNYFEDRKLHYLSGSVAYIVENTRVSLSYGRQRGGLLCVGGVCRPVPASNGFSLSITSSF